MERHLTVRIVAAALLVFCLLAMVSCAGSPSAANNPAPGSSLAPGSPTSQSTSSQPAASTAGAPSTPDAGSPQVAEPDTGPWKDLHPTGGGTPLGGGFQSVNAVYDYRIGRVVLFGVGMSAEQSMDFGTPFTFDRVAMFDGLSSRLSDTGPGGYYLLTVSGRSVVYDTADNVIIKFAGYVIGGGHLGSYVADTITCDPISLAETTLTPVGDVPSARSGQSMVYDPATRRVIMFGGTDGKQVFGDIWSYDPSASAWTKLAPGGAVPAARSDQSMVYVPSTGRIFMFGGTDGSRALSDTWSYDPAANTWTEVTSSTQTPSARSAQTMVYDPATDGALMFGGKDGSATLDDTWLFDMETGQWSLIPAGGPAGDQAGASMVYDAAADGVTMFEAAGLKATTVWKYDEKERRWAVQQTSGTLPFSQLVYDSSTDRALFFGLGETHSGPLTFFDQLYSFDPAKNAWSTSSPPQSAPTYRIGPALAYDPATRQVVMFGGVVGPQELNDTWTYDTVTGAWTNRQPKGAVPSGGMGENLVCDDSTGQVFMLGGIPQDDGGTWSYDPTTNRWTNLHPTGDVRPPLGGSAAAYVPSLHEIVVFGGNYDTYSGDTWAYDTVANSWRNLHPAGATPSARSGASMVYDAARQEIVMVRGERGDGSALGDIWTYDPAANRWTNLLPESEAPSSPRPGALFYAKALGSVVMISARVERSVSLDGTWELTR